VTDTYHTGDRSAAFVIPYVAVNPRVRSQVSNALRQVGRGVMSLCIVPVGYGGVASIDVAVIQLTSAA